MNQLGCFKKNLNASRPSEHPTVKGKNVKTFRWNHRLQRQNLVIPVDLNGFPDGSNIGSTVYYAGEKPTVLLYTYINRHAGTPEKQNTNIALVVHNLINRLINNYTVYENSAIDPYTIRALLLYVFQIVS